MPSAAPPASTSTRSVGSKTQSDMTSAISTSSSLRPPQQQQPPANSLAQLQNDPLLNSVVRSLLDGYVDALADLYL